MSDDSSSPIEKRSWLERLSHAFSGEPESREDLIEILRDARENGILTSDTLKMLEGAEVQVPPQGGRKHPEQKLVKVNTQNILFICGGAFDGIEKDRKSVV